MTTKELLQLDAGDLLKVPEICKAIAEVLNPGPWEHKWQINREVEAMFWCAACEQDMLWSRDKWKVVCDKGMRLGEIVTHLNETEKGCPVPPAITEPAEVVAAGLKEKAVANGSQELRAVVYRYQEITMEYGRMEIWWFDTETTPAQRIIVCLLALGQLGQTT